MVYDPNKKVIQISPELRRELKKIKGDIDARSYDEVIDFLVKATLQVWIGHLHDDEKSWFISWGKDRTHVFNMISSLGSAPEFFSLNQSKESGCVFFKVEKDESEDGIKLLLEDGELVVGDDMKKWIQNKIEDPVTAIDMGLIKLVVEEILGDRSHSEILKYMEKNVRCPACGHLSFSKEFGCVKCGYTLEDKKESNED